MLKYLRVHSNYQSCADIYCNVPPRFLLALLLQLGTRHYNTFSRSMSLMCNEHTDAVVLGELWKT